MNAETRTIKRKRSLGELAALGSRKKTSMATCKKQGSACLLIQILRQYGLLEPIISCLRPQDMLSLALSCKAAYDALIPRAESLENLLSKMPCSGNGIARRKLSHIKSSFFYDYECTEFAQCSSVCERPNIESRSCITCKNTTCDECRIHCVYQSIYDEPDDPESLPNFSGFVLLEPFEVGILSPRHLLLDSDLGDLPEWQNRATNITAGPYHDQGFLDMPLQLNQVGTPEKISEVIDLDLGFNSFRTWSGSSQFGFPSRVLLTLCNIADQRKLLVCEHCFARASEGYRALTPRLPELSWLDKTGKRCVPEGLEKCHCSFRSRVLDRWQCVKCYGNEQSTINEVFLMAPEHQYQQCRCGLPANKRLCMWCWGEITETSDIVHQVISVHTANAPGEA